MRRLTIVVGALLCFALMRTADVSATGFKVMPLKYSVTIKAGESKKGFVDFANTDSLATTVQFSVQSFRQINDNGDLEFYDNQAVSAGVKLDYSEVEIGPRENLHLAFVVDGTKLPKGDSFAAIFATVKPTTEGAATQTVRVGTLLFIENDTPSPRNATISSLSAPLLQIGEGITARFTVTNPGTRAVTGYSPEIAVAMRPYSSKIVTGPFVMAGRTRETTYVQKGDYLGPVVVKVTTNTSTKTQLIFAITGFWRWLFPLLIFVFIVAIASGLQHRLRTRASRPL